MKNDVYWFWIKNEWRPVTHAPIFAVDIEIMKNAYIHRVLPTGKAPKLPPTADEVLDIAITKMMLKEVLDIAITKMMLKEGFGE